MKIFPHCSYSWCLSLSFLWNNRFEAPTAFWTELSATRLVFHWEIVNPGKPFIVLGAVDLVLLVQGDLLAGHVLVTDLTG